MILPREHELMEFFEVEPVLRDPGLPWTYNSVTFTTVRRDGEVRFEIRPGERQMRLTWKRNGEQVVHLRAGRVERLRLEIERTREALVATFAGTSRLDNLVLQLKPFVSVNWGYDFV